MRLRQPMKRAQYLITTARESTKWSAILIVPSAALLIAFIQVTGGIEGGGKLLFLFALAPILIIERFITGADGPATWAAFVIAECGYFFLIVFCFRLFQLHRLCRFAGQSIKTLFRPESRR